MAPAIIEYLTCLESRIDEYGPPISVDGFDWIRILFVKLTGPPNFVLPGEDFLFLLWKSIAKKAIKVLLQFPTSYVCEFGF